MNSASVLSWHFPLPRPYTGILLGNGTMGVMVWGGGHTLHLSIARNGFWDRRGGVPFATTIDYAEVRALLEADDIAGLRAKFTTPQQETGYRKPTQLPGGRLEIDLSSDLIRASLHTDSGRLVVDLADGSSLVLRQSFTQSELFLEGPIGAVRLRPAWEWIGDRLAAGGVTPPRTWGDDQGGGFRQELPEDSALEIVWQRTESGLVVRDTSAPRDGEGHFSFADYRARLPRVVLPDPALQRAWDYGVFKQAGMTPPHAPPATLQGPWMAETGIPPWSNDYHFNINLQMIYWPCLPTNRADHLWPVWRMLIGWLPELRRNAAAFFGAPDALMLPHAVDDRCHAIGNFWQGMIDQACTAWMAQMAWLHYRHTMDETLLRDIAWPLLRGAFEGFWAMCEEDQQGCLSLPVSVSAEFGNWGRNASFQLAAFHMTAGLLQRAAKILDQEPDARWQIVRDRLPAATTMKVAKVWGESELRPRIVLWEGQDLTESHRHHSHLAGIYPFCTLDPEDPSVRDLIRRSIEHWSATGPGQWVGWSMPWAAILWARCGYASAAVSLLRIWADVFTNEGGGTLHNADSPCYSSWLHGPFFDGPDDVRSEDQMQMDAGFGVLQALVEIFVQQRGETLHILPSLPKQWRDFSFDGILCEGAFLAGATVVNGQLTEVRITSQRGGLIEVCFPRELSHNGINERRHRRTTHPGECLVFSLPV